MIINYRDFIKTLVLEEPHPELQSLFQRQTNPAEIARTVRSLAARNIDTGVTEKQPKGSSRIYLEHTDPLKVNIDGQDSEMKIGTKVVIPNKELDPFHQKINPGADSLGVMQNRVENGEPFINKTYRVLIQDSEHPHHYTTNEYSGIFPPLVSHDQEKHLHSQVGHVDSFKSKAQFKNLMITPEFPKGITHSEFCDVLERSHDSANGRHYPLSDPEEKHLDHISTHPIIQKFLNYHDNLAAPPHDYRQLGNLGVFTHPVTKKQYLVARDSGFNTDVQDAYHEARLLSIKHRYGHIHVF